MKLAAFEAISYKLNSKQIPYKKKGLSRPNENPKAKNYDETLMNLVEKEYEHLVDCRVIKVSPLLKADDADFSTYEPSNSINYFKGRSAKAAVEMMKAALEYFNHFPKFDLLSPVNDKTRNKKETENVPAQHDLSAETKEL